MMITTQTNMPPTNTTPTNPDRSTSPPAGAPERQLVAGVVRRPFRTPVRGFPFAARAPGTSAPVPGQLARLIREPGNPADELAVGVWVADGAAGPWRIGYLDRTVAARLAPRLDRGARFAARLEGWSPEPDGRWHRPVLVVLPAVEGAQEDPDPPDNGPSRSARPARAPATLWGRPPGVSRRTVGRGGVGGRAA